MTSAHPMPDTTFDAALRMPSRGLADRASPPEDPAFSSGAALAYLDVALQAPAVPLTLVRARLALRAATVCVGLTGRSEGAGALHAVLPAQDRADIARWRAAGQGAPVSRAAAVLEAGALILAEAALAQAL